jgi:hypothetical protein
MSPKDEDEFVDMLYTASLHPGPVAIRYPRGIGPNAAIKKTEASNQWNYFQAKSTKQSLAELARDLAPEDKKAAYLAKVERYEKEKAEIKAVADKLEADGAQWDKQSDEQMHQHHRWAQATTVLQVAIAMAAIALLTRKKWLEYAMFAAGATGIVIGLLAAIHI